MDIKNKFTLVKAGFVVSVVVLVVSIILLFFGGFITILAVLFLICSLIGGVTCWCLISYYKSLYSISDVIKSKKINDISVLAKEIKKTKGKTLDLVKACLRYNVLKDYAFINNELYPISARDSACKSVSAIPIIVKCNGCGAKFQGYEGEVGECPYCKSKIIC